MKHLDWKRIGWTALFVFPTAFLFFFLLGVVPVIDKEGIIISLVLAGIAVVDAVGVPTVIFGSSFYYHNGEEEK